VRPSRRACSSEANEFACHCLYCMLVTCSQYRMYPSVTQFSTHTQEGPPVTAFGCALTTAPAGPHLTRFPQVRCTLRLQDDYRWHFSSAMVIPVHARHTEPVWVSRSMTML
jgi:hypothetical protein